MAFVAGSTNAEGKIQVRNLRETLRKKGFQYVFTGFISRQLACFAEIALVDADFIFLNYSWPMRKLEKL